VTDLLRIKLQLQRQSYHQKVWGRIMVGQLQQAALILHVWHCKFGTVHRRTKRCFRKT